MSVDTKNIRNVVLLGHSGCRKTTLSEAMLYESGAISRMGTIATGNTMSDYTAIEQERGNSLFSSLMHVKWRDCKINILDTPGSDDFIGEVVCSMKVADTAIMVLNGAHGVEVGTEILWDYVKDFATPTIFAITQMDHEKADFEATLEQARERFGSKVLEHRLGLHRRVLGEPDREAVRRVDAERAAGAHADPQRVGDRRGEPRRLVGEEAVDLGGGAHAERVAAALAGDALQHLGADAQAQRQHRHPDAAGRALGDQPIELGRRGRADVGLGVGEQHDPDVGAPRRPRRAAQLVGPAQAGLHVGHAALGQPVDGALDRELLIARRSAAVGSEWAGLNGLHGLLMQVPQAQRDALLAALLALPAQARAGLATLSLRTAPQDRDALRNALLQTPEAARAAWLRERVSGP